MNDPVTAYAHDVLGGKTPAGPFVRLACERHLRDLKQKRHTFDPEAAQMTFDFFHLLRHSKGEWAGVPFDLEPWEQFIIGSLFGWKRSDGLRRFRSGYVAIPKKNGKSTLAAGTGLRLFVLDDEPGAEIYTAATKRDQARIVHSEAIRMVRSSRSLNGRIRILKDNLNIAATNSKYEPLGADANSTEGINPHGAIIDELHVHRDGEMFHVLESAMVARQQPMIFGITTAGSNRHSFCGEYQDYAEKVLTRTVEEDELFVYIAGTDKDDDWTDPAIWRKANPNFGISVKEGALARECRKAQELPSHQNSFLQRHLNVWTQQVTRWIPLELWDANAGVVVADKLKGRSCYGGLDLSAVSDLTAWVMLFPEDDRAVQVLARFWCPEARLTDSANPYRDLYQAWARDGYLTPTPGNAVDYTLIREQVFRDAAEHEMLELGIDALFQGQQLAGELIDAGLKVVAVRPTAMALTPPVRDLERRLQERKFHHGGNPVLRWQVDGAALKETGDGLVKPIKGSPHQKIDGLISILMGLSRLMYGRKRSVYEDHGIRTLEL